MHQVFFVKFLTNCLHLWHQNTYTLIKRTHSVSQEPYGYNIIQDSSALLPISTTSMIMLPVMPTFKSIALIRNTVPPILSYPILSYIYPCHKAYMALIFSFHPLWFVARAVTAACNCNSAACLLFSTVLLNVAFGCPGLRLPSGNLFLTNHLITWFLCCAWSQWSLIIPKEGGVRVCGDAVCLIFGAVLQ